MAENQSTRPIVPHTPWGRALLVLNSHTAWNYGEVDETVQKYLLVVFERMLREELNGVTMRQIFVKSRRGSLLIVGSNPDADADSPDNGADNPNEDETSGLKAGVIAALEIFEDAFCTRRQFQLL